MLEKAKKKGYYIVEEKARGTYEKKEYIFINDMIGYIVTTNGLVKINRCSNKNIPKLKG